MLAVYLDGIELQEDFKKLVVSSMGPLNHTCSYCGGSFVEVNKILIRSSETLAIFYSWCISCGKVSRITEAFPIEWHNRLMAKVISEASEPVQCEFNYQGINF
jgi:hypothetical protein